MVMKKVLRSEPCKDCGTPILKVVSWALRNPLCTDCKRDRDSARRRELRQIRTMESKRL